MVRFLAAFFGQIFGDQKIKCIVLLGRNNVVSSTTRREKTDYLVFTIYYSKYKKYNTLFEALCNTMLKYARIVQ